MEGTSLEDKLLEKGVITREDWLEIKAEEERRLAERTEAIEFTGSPRWYERIRLYGLGMIRYNQLGHPNGKLINWQDVSVGSGQYGGQPGFLLRRVRIVLTGQVSDHVAFFFQPDFVSQVPATLSNNTNTGVATIRDAWADWYFDQHKEYRVRLGLQRTPCSFDNWQSTRQRIAIDRADATTSCNFNERGLGGSFQWTPVFAQHRWKRMIDYMNGAGDWGMINFTVYNGQGLNVPTINGNEYVGLRLAYPLELPGGRLMEIGMNANKGTINVNMGTPNSTSVNLFSLNEARQAVNTDYRDEHLNFYFYLPPQPWGLQAEYVVGRTPRRDWQGIVKDSALYGGYVQGHYQWKYSDTGLVNFYTRWQEYYGGLQFLQGAPDGRMREWETGFAWMPDPQWEITMSYSFTQRLNYAQMTAPTLNPVCDNRVGLGGTPNNVVQPDYSTCNPQPQFNAYANLIRLQVMWFFN